MLDKPIQDAVDSFRSNIEWMKSLFNLPFGLEDLDDCISVLESAVGEVKLSDALTARTERILERFAGAAVETSTVCTISGLDKDRYRSILLFFFNIAGALERPRIQTSFRIATELVDMNLSLMDSIKLIRALTTKLAPLLAVSSIETASSRYFLDQIDQAYSDLKEERNV